MEPHSACTACTLAVTTSQTSGKPIVGSSLPDCQCQAQQSRRSSCAGRRQTWLNAHCPVWLPRASDGKPALSRRRRCSGTESLMITSAVELLAGIGQRRLSGRSTVRRGRGRGRGLLLLHTQHCRQCWLPCSIPCRELQRQGLLRQSINQSIAQSMRIPSSFLADAGRPRGPETSRAHRNTDSPVV